MNELGVRSGGVATLSDLRTLFMDWTIDGISLRAAYAEESADRFMTLLQDAPQYQADRTESLRRLRGDAMPPPAFEARFYQTRLDRLLHRRGTPHAPWGTAFEDGRIGLVFCPCGDLDCPTLSTRLIVTAETIEWRDIGWQVTYEPFGTESVTQAEELGHATFDRIAYETLIADLLRKSGASD